MTLHAFIAYFTILIIATITPGPSMILALNHGVNYGLKKTLYSCAGNVAGNILMALISVTGLGVILAVSGLMFNVIRWAGAIYLVYLGYRLITAPVDEKIDVMNEHDNKHTGKLFIDGFIIAIGNPKGIVFFTALFPQFIITGGSSMNSYIIIFSALGGVAFACYMLYAAAGSKLKVLSGIRKFMKRFNCVSGILMIGSGLTLVFTEKG